MTNNPPEPKSPLQHVLISSMKDGMVQFVQAHPDCLTELLDLAVSDKQPYAWRAAWLLTNVIDDNDARVRPYIGKMVNALDNKEDGHLRELLKVLVMMELNDDMEGPLFDRCIGLWKSASKAPAVRYTAFRFIYKLTKKHPELYHEVKLLTEKEYMDSLSRGVKHSVGKLMRELQRCYEN